MSVNWVFALLALAAVASAKDQPVWTDGNDGWSNGVDYLRARLLLKPREVTNGTLIIEPCLDLQNLASIVHFRWTNAKMTVHVVDADGHDLKPDLSVYDGFERPKADLVIPIEGELSFNISGNGAGIPADSGALIDLGDPDTSWIIPRNGEAYFLKAELEVAGKPSKNTDGSRNWAGSISLPPVQIPEHAPQPDPSKVGAIIDELGRKMLLGHGSESAEATWKLSLIDDQRVVGWYLKAAKTNDYGLKFEALDKLCRFPGDDAFEGLKIGMHTTASDLRGGGIDLAANLRDAAAEALARSPHPNAKELLLTMADDHSLGVRLAVIHTAATLRTPQAVAILKQMATDHDKVIRDEATRELAALAKGKN